MCLDSLFLKETESFWNRWFKNSSAYKKCFTYCAKNNTKLKNSNKFTYIVIRTQEAYVHKKRGPVVSIIIIIVGGRLMCIL